MFMALCSPKSIMSTCTKCHYCRRMNLKEKYMRMWNMAFTRVVRICVYLTPLLLMELKLSTVKSTIFVVEIHF